jgi:hypothetical protein
MRQDWIGLWIALMVAIVAGCSTDSPGCRSACERPAVVLQEQAEDTLVWWHALSSPLKEGAQGAEKTWRQEFVAANDGFVEACVSSCTHGALTADIECRRRAETVVAWTHCFKP